MSKCTHDRNEYAPYDPSEHGSLMLSVDLPMGDWETLLAAYTAAQHVMLPQDPDAAHAMGVCARLLWQALNDAGFELDHPQELERVDAD